MLNVECFRPFPHLPRVSPESRTYSSWFLTQVVHALATWRELSILQCNNQLTRTARLRIIQRYRRHQERRIPSRLTARAATGMGRGSVPSRRRTCPHYTGQDPNAHHAVGSAVGQATAVAVALADRADAAARSCETD